MWKGGLDKPNGTPVTRHLRFQVEDKKERLFESVAVAACEEYVIRDVKAIREVWEVSEEYVASLIFSAIYKMFDNHYGTNAASDHAVAELDRSQMT